MTTPEDVAAHQGQGLGQLGVLFLEFVVIGRGLIEHALKLFHSRFGVLGLLLGVWACCWASSACCRSSSLLRSRSWRNCWYSRGSSGSRSVMLMS